MGGIGARFLCNISFGAFKVDSIFILVFADSTNVWRKLDLFSVRKQLPCKASVSFLTLSKYFAIRGYPIPIQTDSFGFIIEWYLCGWFVLISSVDISPCSSTNANRLVFSMTEIKDPRSPSFKFLAIQKLRFLHTTGLTSCFCVLFVDNVDYLWPILSATPPLFSGVATGVSLTSSYIASNCLPHAVQFRSRFEDCALR